MNCNKLTMVVLALLVALAAGTTGCKKGMVAPTPIHGNTGRTGPEGPGPDAGSPRNQNPGGGVPIGQEGNPGGGRIGDIALPPGGNPDEHKLGTWDPSKMDQNRNIFADQTVYFDFDKNQIRPGEDAKLDQVAAKFIGMPASNGLLIEGHCDERGTEEYNRSLGERRALAIRDYLIEKGHIPAERIQTKSLGENEPADPGHNEAAWSKNRRGVIVLCTPK